MKNPFKEYKAFLSKLAIILLSVLIFLILRYIEHRASPYLSFYIFYLIPVTLVSWFVGVRAGLFFSVVSFLVWLIDDFGDAHVFGYSVISTKILNQALKFIFICIFIYLIGNIKKLLNNLKEFDKLKSQFVANVSHEIRSPLFMVKESLAVILDGLKGRVDPEQKEILELGKKNVDRLLRLSADLLDLSKIEAGKMELKVEEIDISALLCDILKSFEFSFAKKHITFKSDIAQDAGLLRGDRDKLAGVIINLLNNALKYTPESGSVTLAVRGDEKDLRFEISDTGPGIPKGYQDKIFDKFERITTEKQEGTGLGLPISRDIVRLHKGRLWAESEPGKGSTFICILPRNLKK